MWCKAKLIQVHEKQCLAEVLEVEQKAPRLTRLHLAIAPTKQIDRIEWMLEKCVELGIEEISFLHCDNSERTSLKVERMQKIAESAMKQSLQAFLPKVNGLVKFEQILSVPASTRFIAHCHTGVKTLMSSVNFSGQHALILIGPEGDFSEKEVSEAVSAGFLPLDLGSNRLRTETAGLAVCLKLAL